MSEVRCPKCKSNQISANKRGFSVGKAVVGSALTLGVGVLAGASGSGKIIITCLACRHQFKPGEDLDSVNRVIVNNLEKKAAFQYRMSERNKNRVPLTSSEKIVRWAFFGGIILIFLAWLAFG